MPEVTKKAPVIRFKGFSDAWEQRKLGDDKDVRDGTHDSPKYHKEGHPLVTSKNLNDYGLDMTDVSLISDADFEAINKRSKVDNGDILFGMIGTIGNPVIVDRSDFAIKNVALIKEGGDIPNRFLIQLLKSSVFEKYIRNENAGNTQKFLGLSKIREFTFFTPTTEEQIRIATFFKQLDDTIALHQRKLTLFNQLKETYLKQMFPQNEENMSVLRFADFSEPWEQRKWSETVDISTEMVNPKTGEYDSLPHIGPGNIESFTGRILDNVKSVKEDNLISGKFHFYPGDVIYGKINPQLGKYAMVDFEGLASADSYVLNTKNGVSQTFLFTILQGTSFYKYSVSVSMRTGMPKINRDELNQYSYSAPSIVEQEKIGHFFQQLDDTSALHQEKIAHLKVLKSTLLNKMFI